MVGVNHSRGTVSVCSQKKVVPRATLSARPYSISRIRAFFIYKIKNGVIEMKYQKLKGTQDLLPEELTYWHYIEETVTPILEKYHFSEIRLPIMEKLDLFTRSVGESSDIVTKEMYEFFDKGDRHIALRPEGTASVARAFVENKLFGPEHQKPLKYYYNGPMFRYERPQSGRMRQFHQLGVEVFGSRNPATDVETIAMAMEFFQKLKLGQLRLVINSLGDAESRAAYRTALINYLTPFSNELSKDSVTRLNQNPLRVLDSKDKTDQEIVKNAPSILDFLNEPSKEHFTMVQTLLKELNIPFEIDSNMVRGLDYYNDTIFEIMADSKDFGSNTTVCAGGRYDSLVEDVGGPATPAFGFAFGLERLVMMLKSENVVLPDDQTVDVYVVGIGGKTNTETLKLVQSLRAKGLSAERDYLFRKPKAQFKTADRLNAKIVLTIGENELETKMVNVKYMQSGKQEAIPLKFIYDENNFEFLEH